MRRFFYKKNKSFSQKLGEGADTGALSDFILEIAAMHQLKHPNLLPLYGIIPSSPLKMVTQLAPGGSLISKLRKNRKLNIMRLCEYCVQVATGKIDNRNEF